MKKENWLALGLGFACIFRAQAATFYVTDTNDTVHSFSLRGAIIAANRTGGNNTIILGSNPGVPRTLKQKQWTYPLTIWGQDEDAAQRGDLEITQGHLTISGSASNVTIDASALGDRVFHVLPKAQLTLKNLTILGGTAPSITYVEPGNGSIFTSLKRNAPHNTATITAIGSAG